METCVGVRLLIIFAYKVLKIYDFGQDALDMDSFVAMVIPFLVTMTHLERFMVYCDGNVETRQNLLIKIRGIPWKASLMCRNQVLEC